MNTALKTTIHLFIITVITGFLSYGVRVIFARNLSLAEYGLFYAVLSLVFLLGYFRDLGLSESSVFFINKFLAKKNQAKLKGVMLVCFIPQVFVGLGIALVLFLSRNILAELYFKEPLAASILLFIIALFLVETIIPTIEWIFAAYQKVIYQKMSYFVKTLLTVIIALVLFPLMTPVYVPAVSILLAAVITALLFSGLFIKHFPWVLRVKARVNKQLIREVFTYALPLLFSTSTLVILSYTDAILLTVLRGVEAVGLYNIAQPIIGIIGLLITPVTIILFPKISQLYHTKSNKSISAVLSFVYNNLLLLSIITGLVFFAYPDLIISTLFGSQYLAATNTLRMFAILYIFTVITAVNYAVMAAIGQVKERSIILLIAATVNIVLNFIFIPLYGPTGAALTTGISFGVIAVLSTKAILKKYPIKIHFLDQGKVLFAAAIFTGTIFVLKKLFMIPWPLVEAVIILVLAGLVYVGALYVLKVITKEKIQHVISLMK